MRVGSKVMYVGGRFKPSTTALFLENGYTLPEPDKVYTVDGIYESNTVHGRMTFILLVEIKNPPCKHAGGKESGYNIKAFREIDTHPELSETTYEEILQEIEEQELQTA